MLPGVGSPKETAAGPPSYGRGRWPWVTGDSINPAPPYSPCPVLGAVLTSPAGPCARWRAWVVKPAVLQLKTFFRRRCKKPEKEASERGWNEWVTERSVCLGSSTFCRVGTTLTPASCAWWGVPVCEGLGGASDLDGAPNKGERLSSCKATEDKGPSRKPADWEFDVWPVVSSSPRRTV